MSQIQGHPYLQKEHYYTVNHILILTRLVGDFNIPLSPINRSSRQKLQRNAEASRHYKQNGPNGYLQSISPEHKQIHLLLCISWNFLQNWPYAYTENKSQQIQQTEITLCSLSEHQGLKLDSNNRDNRKLRLMETEQLFT